MTKFFAALAAALMLCTSAFAGEGQCPSQCQNSGQTAAASEYQVALVKEGSGSANKPGSGSAAKTKDIVDTAASLKDFSTLVAAVKAAGLVDALKGDGPFTVFAPTNEAFAKLPAGTVENLLKPENKDQLTSVLLYHVVPAKVTAADVVKVTSADTLLQGKKLAVAVKDGKVFINDAQVIKTDVPVSNGVIHVVDTVILP